MRTAPVFRVLGPLQADRDGSPLPLPAAGSGLCSPRC